MTQLAAPASACPRCHKPLIDPSGLGWCKACGYCRSLAESETKTAPADAAAAVPANQFTATSAALGQTPTWVWITLAGLPVIAAISFACGRWLPLDPFGRALFTTLQIAAGVGILFVGQCIGLMKIAPDEPSINFWDAIFPFRLYGLLFKRLPSTRHTIYLAAWGIAAILCAAIFIGGLGHWFKYIPGNQKNVPQKTKR